MKTLIFDIETTGLNPTAKSAKMHVMCGTYIDDSDVIDKEMYDATEVMLYINTMDLIIGHYITGFDIPYLEGITGIRLSPTVRVSDTKTMAAALYPDIEDVEGAKSKHSLEAWGKRLGCLKGDFSKTTDWKTCDAEMVSYCHQDVTVTRKLFYHLMKTYAQLDKDCEEIVHQQTVRGVGFDTKKALDIMGELYQDKQDTLKLLINTVSSGYKEVLDFNPNSGAQIACLLTDKYGWTPKKVTPTGKAATDSSILSSLDYPECKLLMSLASIKKFMRTVSDGDEGWMKHVVKGRIHGRVNVLGATTGRMSHYSPNLAQVPNKDEKYGKLCRELFIPYTNEVMVGCDASGIELRCFAHYLAPYDGGQLVETILKGDIHQNNADLLGCSRDTAKHFIYAFMYGAMPKKLAEVLECTLDEAKRIKRVFEEKFPGYKNFNNNLTNASQRGYIIALDGRHISTQARLYLGKLDSDYRKLNKLLQSAAAIIFKKAMCIAYEKMPEIQFMLSIHDEWQVSCKKEEADETGKFLVQCIKDAGTYYKFRCPLDGEYKIGSSWGDTH